VPVGSGLGGGSANAAAVLKGVCKLYDLEISNNELKKICDLNKTEIFILSSLAFLTLFFGFYPEPLLRTVDISVSELIRNYEMDLTFYLKEAAK